MKRMLILVLAVMVLLPLSLTETTEAHQRDHDWSHSAYQKYNWHQSDNLEEFSPFKWHERHERHERFSPSKYKMEQIHDKKWNNRFPGLRSYKWNDSSGEGFWYHGDRITNAILFYDHRDELVSIGFMHNGSFIFLRDDHNGYESHESFVVSWLIR